MELIYPKIAIKLLTQLKMRPYSRTEIRKGIPSSISTTIFNNITEVMVIKNLIVITHEYRKNASRPTQILSITQAGSDLLNQN